MERTAIKIESFSVLLTVSGVPDQWSPYDTSYKDFVRELDSRKLDYDETEPGESEYDYLATELGEPEEGTHWHEWKHGVQDLTCAVILPRADFVSLMEDLGAFPEDCETMGTLGGPLGPGIVPDISFRCESQLVIACIRATPMLSDDFLKAHPDGITEDIWQHLRAATFELFE